MMYMRVDKLQVDASGETDTATRSTRSLPSGGQMIQQDFHEVCLFVWRGRSRSFRRCRSQWNGTKNSCENESEEEKKKKRVHLAKGRAALGAGPWIGTQKEQDSTVVLCHRDEQLA